MVFTVCFTVVETKLDMHMNNIQAAPKKQSQFKVLVVVGAGQTLNKLTHRTSQQLLQMSEKYTALYSR